MSMCGRHVAVGRGTSNSRHVRVEKRQRRPRVHRLHEHLSVALKPAVGRRVAQRFALGAQAAALDTARLSAQRCDCDQRRDRGRIDVGGVPAVPARTGPARSHSRDPGCQPYLYRAVHARDVCPRCDVARLLPGLTSDVPICRHCTGISRRFTCRRRRTEGQPCHGEVCVHYRLHDLAHELLDDGTGTVPSGAATADRSPSPTSCRPLPKAGCTGCTSDAPESCSLRCPPASSLSATLDALLDTPTTHPGPAGALLVAAGCLPAIDDVLHCFEAWLLRRLTERHTTRTSGCCARLACGTTGPKCAPG